MASELAVMRLDRLLDTEEGRRLLTDAVMEIMRTRATVDVGAVAADLAPMLDAQKLSFLVEVLQEAAQRSGIAITIPNQA